MDKSSSKVLKYRPIGDAAKESAEYIDQRRKGLIRSLKLPWSKYNDVAMGGIEWYTIHTIGGMSGSGKTATLNQLETEVISLNPDENLAVLSFNFEMLARNLVSRKISNKLGKTVKELHSGEDGRTVSDELFQEVEKTTESLSKLPIYYVETSGAVDDIRKTIVNFAQEDYIKGKGVLVLLDHTLLVNGRSGEQERITLVNLMVMFNELKKSFHEAGMRISFVILTQLNRRIEESDRLTDASQHFPMKKDIFGGDAIYQFSDVVMVSMNPEQLGLGSYGTDGWPVEGFLYWHFLKVREGEPVVARMENELKFNRITDWVPDHLKQIQFNT
jgi:replicative DNA helicase